VTETSGHVLDDDGVTPVRFKKTGPTTWTNVDGITLKQGSVLTVGNISLVYPEPDVITDLGLFDTPDQP